MDELQREALNFFRHFMLVLPRLHLNFHLTHSISVWHEASVCIESVYVNPLQKHCRT